MKKTVIVLLLIITAFASLFAFSMPVSFNTFLKNIGFFKVETERKSTSNRNQLLRKRLKEEYEQVERYRASLMANRKRAEDDFRERSKNSDVALRGLIDLMVSSSGQDNLKIAEQYAQMQAQQGSLNLSRKSAETVLRQKNEQVSRQMKIVVDGLMEDNETGRQMLSERLQKLEDQKLNLLTHREFAEENFLSRNESVNQELNHLVENLIARSAEDRAGIQEKLDHLESQKRTIMENLEEAERRINENTEILDAQIGQLVNDLIDETAQSWNQAMEKSQDQIQQFENTHADRIDQAALLEKQKERMAQLEAEQQKLFDAQNQKQRRQKDVNRMNRDENRYLNKRY